MLNQAPRRDALEPLKEWLRDHTFMVEILHRDHRIMVEYPEDQVVLIAARHKESGLLWAYEDLKRVADLGGALH